MKQIIIKTPKECPYRICEYNYICNHEKNFRKDCSDNSFFPFFCPLGDYYECYEDDLK